MFIQLLQMTWIEPRFRTQQIGMGLSVALFGVIILYVAGRLYIDFRKDNLLDRPFDIISRGYQLTKNISPAFFWLILAVFSAGMFGIGEMRGDFAEILYGIRVDQWLDVLFSVISLVIALMLMITRGKYQHNTGEQNA